MSLYTLSEVYSLLLSGPSPLAQAAEALGLVGDVADYLSQECSCATKLGRIGHHHNNYQETGDNNFSRFNLVDVESKSL